MSNVVCPLKFGSARIGKMIKAFVSGSNATVSSAVSSTKELD